MNVRIWMLPQGVMAGIFLLYAIAALNGSSYDWDIDHMMYFGGRLLQGEPVWTREFDDKLPLVQVLFAAPAAIGSVKAWQALSILSVLAAAFALWLALRQVLAGDWGLAPDVAGAIALSGSTVYLFLAAVLPGSLSHINPMAASLLTLATLLLLARRPGRSNLFLAVPGTLLAPAVLASLAVSMRPYLLAPALLAGAWAALRQQDELRSSPRSRLVDVALWVVAFAATGFALNVAPYLVTGELGSFNDGLSLLGQRLNPQTLLANASLQVRGIYFGNDLVAYIVVAWMAFGAWTLLDIARRDGALLRHRNARVDVLFAVLLSPLALELMILNKHFWLHYHQLFIPYAAAAMAFMLAAVVATRPSRAPGGAVSLLLLGAFLVAVRVDVSRSALGAVRASEVAHEWEAERRAVIAFLRERGAAGASFLNPSHMYLHWTLGQARHGFPHAAHTLHISQDWWARVRKPRGVDLPLTRQEYCARLERQGPRFILDRPDHWLMGCFTGNPASRYRQAALLDIRPGTRLAVFERWR